MKKTRSKKSRDTVPLMEGFSKLVNNFKGARYNFDFDFFHQQGNKKNVNHQRMYKSTFIILSLQKID
jgi:hypothetical protein